MIKYYDYFTLYKYHYTYRNGLTIINNNEKWLNRVIVNTK